MKRTDMPVQSRDIVPFYDRSVEERIAITEAAIGESRTLLERWIPLGDHEASGWNPRAAAAAVLLADQSKVVDFGCGTMILERHLRGDQSYVPVDVVVRDGRTIVVDLNRDLPPRILGGTAACLGLLEYLYRPLAFLRYLSDNYSRLVLSYCTRDAPQAPTIRREHGWVNDFSAAELEELFSQSGWGVDCREPVDGLQTLWRLTARA